MLRHLPYVVVFRFTTFGRIPSKHGFAALTATYHRIGDENHVKPMSTFKMFVHTEYFKDEPKLVNTVHDDYVHSECEKSDLTPKQVVDEFMSWVGVITQSTRDLTYLATDSVTSHGVFLSMYADTNIETMFSTSRDIRRERPIIDINCIQRGISREPLSLRTLDETLPRTLALDGLRDEFACQNVPNVNDIDYLVESPLYTKVDMRMIYECVNIFRRWNYIQKCLYQVSRCNTARQKLNDVVGESSQFIFKERPYDVKEKEYEEEEEGDVPEVEEDESEVVEEDSPSFAESLMNELTRIIQTTNKHQDADYELEKAIGETKQRVKEQYGIDVDSEAIHPPVSKEWPQCMLDRLAQPDEHLESRLEKLAVPERVLEEEVLVPGMEHKSLFTDLQLTQSKFGLYSMGLETPHPVVTSAEMKFCIESLAMKNLAPDYQDIERVPVSNSNQEELDRVHVLGQGSDAAKKEEGLDVE